MPSQDGWEPARVPEGSPMLEWRVVPGSSPPVHLQVLKGWAATILLAWAADMNAFVEHMRDEDSCCYTPTNSVATSNHLNATGFDFNWKSHPFHAWNTFNSGQMATLNEMFNFYKIDGLSLIAWGGKDWGGNPQDEMHFQMGNNTWNNPRVLDWINANIRPDGFSTFRRGGEVGHPVIPPPSHHESDDPINVLARAVNISQAKAEEILETLQQGLILAQATNVNRIAMDLAQWGHESGSFVYTEEIAKNGRYAPYIGRTWIQITWDYNYRAFSEWLFSKGLIPTSTYFLDHPKELADIKWAGIGPAWYTVVARPQLNGLADQRNLVQVTQVINGGQNGAADRKKRYDLALSMGDQLMVLVGNPPQTQPQPQPQPQPEDDFMSELSAAEQRALFNEIMGDGPSNSPLRKPGEGNIGRPLQVLRYMDGNVHVLLEKLLVALGDPEETQNLHNIVNMDPNLPEYPHRQKDRVLALSIIEDSKKPDAPAVAVQRTIAYEPAPQTFAPVPPTEGGTIGQATGAAIDALVNLKKVQEALGSETLSAVDAALVALQSNTGGK